MAKPPILGTLEALDALADLGSAQAAKKTSSVEPLRPATRGGSNVRPGQQPQAAADPVLSMLAELKRDIDSLKREQTLLHHDQQELQLHETLSDLKRDIAILRGEQATQVLPSGDRHLESLLSELRRDIVALKGEQATQSLPSGERHLQNMLADLRRDIVTLRHEQSSQHLPHGDTHLYAMLAELKRDIHDLHHAPAHHDMGRHGRDHAHADHAMARSLRDPALEGTDRSIGGMRTVSERRPWTRELLSYIPLLALAAVVLYPLVRPGQKPAAPLPQATSNTAAVPSIVRGPVGASGEILTPLYDAMASGTVSPRGVSVAGIDAQQSLARASALLSAAGSARDTEEGSFWLKRYLAAQPSDRKLMRALTQLGSIYAEPSTTRGPDFVRARMLWEVASALGDPVAMCFLGRLFENGLGVTTDKAAAAQWLDRAKEAGGCSAGEVR